MPYHVVPWAADATSSYGIHQKLLSRVDMGRVTVAPRNITVICRVIVKVIVIRGSMIGKAYVVPAMIAAQKWRAFSLVKMTWPLVCVIQSGSIHIVARGGIMAIQRQAIQTFVYVVLHSTPSKAQPLMPVQHK